jgi:hypothetical protein
MDLQFVTVNSVGLDMLPIILTILVSISLTKYYTNKKISIEFNKINNKLENIISKLNDQTKLNSLITKVDNNNEDLYQLKLKIYEISFCMIDIKYENKCEWYI